MKTIFDLVKADLDMRDRLGSRQYGKPMLPHDGRDTLWDAYEEVLDLAVYLRKAIAEQDRRAGDSEAAQPHPRPTSASQGILARFFKKKSHDD